MNGTVDDDGGFEVTVRVYKREEHQPPDLGFLEGLDVWQGFQQLLRRSLWVRLQ
ncbi:hypothetical protein Hdeb2414_s0006g00192471 [Helianthus debilis subsp. tardiflorus]